MSQQRTVFISYRRALSRHLARSIYLDLRANDWDVFLDVNNMDSGDFDKLILNQISARAHFILLITSDSLARCIHSGDWVLREIEEAVRLNRNIVPIIEEGASFEREMSYLPVELRAAVSRKNALPLTHFFFEPAMEMLRNRFLKAPAYVKISTPSRAEKAEVQRRMASIEAAPVPYVPVFDEPSTPRPHSASLMPKPFAWIDIPASAPLPAFSITKYPVTNLQFSRFMAAGGYRERRWWTEAGWNRCQEENWVQPCYWTESQWNNARQPVVGVSWYEAMAFCLWLSEETGERITLPSEHQWQYAAHGDEDREYPWGNDWDPSCCNNNVDGNGVGTTTPVTQYEGRGDSPFGVTDMSGNVWEWCLTAYTTGGHNPEGTDVRVLRGGSWDFVNAIFFRCDSRNRNYPYYRQGLDGFRCVRNA